MVGAGLAMAKSLPGQTENRIRKRATYGYWKTMFEFLQTKPSVADILRHFHSFLDSNHMYGTEQQARWSEESLHLVIKDLL